MKRLLPLALLLAACAPAVRSQPVQVWEGSGRVLLRTQDYRLTFTVDPVTYALSGTLLNRSSGDRFEASGTLLPTVDGAQGAELTARITAGGSPRLKASVLGFGLGSVPLKADALLGGQVTGKTFAGSLSVNGIRYPLTLQRVR